MEKIGLCDVITQTLTAQRINYQIFNEIEPNPSFDTVEKGVEKLLSAKSDLIIAVGGGSVIDAAKALIYFAQKASNHSALNYTKPYFIAVPTTSGTGSEVTSYSVVTDLKSHLKIALVADEMIPDLAILDPQFTKSCPPHVTAETGFDALSHALESYVSINSSTFTEALVEKVVALIFKHLEVVYKDGNNLESRLLMHEASCLAGIAFTQTGLGLSHAMAHSLGGRFPISHGRANALLFPHIMAFNSRSSAAKYSQLSSLLRLPASTTTEGAVSLITSVVLLNDRLALPRSVLDFGISKEDYLAAVPAMALTAKEDGCLATNPVQPTVAEIEKIYLSLL